MFQHTLQSRAAQRNNYFSQHANPHVERRSWKWCLRDSSHSKIDDCAAHGLSAACRLSNVFIIGKDDKPLISLPKGKGVRLDILQEQAKREAQRA